MEQAIKRVLILGRPNVGKSTLFNRLLRKKQAITSPIPGVTRDLIESVWTLPSGQCCQLIDSAGCRPDTCDALEILAQKKALQEIREANLILLVVEGHALVAQDYLLIDDLRKAHKPVILVANKCDSPEKDHVLGDLWGLGFGEPVCISAEHNRNISQLEYLISQQLPQETADAPIAEPTIRLALLGRPNAGKSSLFNCLCQKERAIVSDVAGTTRDIVTSVFQDKEQKFEILDTAGLRRQSKVHEPVEFYANIRTEAAIEQCDIALLLIDSTQGLSTQDKKIADKIVKMTKPLIFVFTKSDLQQNTPLGVKSKPRQNDILKKKVEELRFQFPVLSYVPVVAVSIKQPSTMAGLLKEIKALYKEAGRQVRDNELQEALGQWCQDNPPVHKRGKRPTHFKSLRQVGQYPPRFALKVYGEVEENYVRYITKNLRKEFHFPHAPIQMDIIHK